MKSLLIVLLYFGGIGMLLGTAILLYCAWEFYQATERTRRLSRPPEVARDEQGKPIKQRL